MGAKSTRKGKRGERRVVRLLRDEGLYPDSDLRRGQQDRNCPVTEADIEGTPFWLESKIGKKHSPRAALRQMVKDTDACGDLRPRVAFIQDDSTGGGRPAFKFICMPEEDFLLLMHALASLSWHPTRE